MVDNIDDIINWDDVDHIFHNVLDNPTDDLFTLHDSPPPTFQQIEQLLMNDDDVGLVSFEEAADPQFAADFLSDVLVDSPLHSDHSPSAEEAIGFPDSKVSSGSEGDQDKDKVSSGSEGDQHKDKVSQSPSDSADELNKDDPVDKKRKRYLFKSSGLFWY